MSRLLAAFKNPRDAIHYQPRLLLQFLVIRRGGPLSLLSHLLFVCVVRYRAARQQNYKKATEGTG
ncbi:hypothetical protein EJ02DRAFT_452638 [Clathrospora elynae]|uniref:Uncharacterized protein n=1 Tax=Clathrospora elynae TaxID=706981 RepID=A0A6A5SWK1_9PLEO|nr:hypothetical protein EJ02DRAFT_452638 [Clathrospora elynae]